MNVDNVFDYEKLIIHHAGVACKENEYSKLEYYIYKLEKIYQFYEVNGIPLESLGENNTEEEAKNELLELIRIFKKLLNLVLILPA